MGVLFQGSGSASATAAELAELSSMWTLAPPCFSLTAIQSPHPNLHIWNYLQLAAQRQKGAS